MVRVVTLYNLDTLKLITFALLPIVRIRIRIEMHDPKKLGLVGAIVNHRIHPFVHVVSFVPGAGEVKHFEDVAGPDLIAVTIIDRVFVRGIHVRKSTFHVLENLSTFNGKTGLEILAKREAEMQGS